jgi:glycerol kinase
MSKYILALDQGTTSCRSLLINHTGDCIAISQKEFTQYFPKSAWVEHDAQEIWQTQYNTIKEVVAQANISYDQIAAIGITNQRETTVVWDKTTGLPLHHAIVWQDRRTADMCKALINDGWSEPIKNKTGLVIDAYFSGSKMKWLLTENDAVAKCAAAGNVAFGTIDSWLVWNLTNGALHITDVSNASRTMLYNIHDHTWDVELTQLFGIPLEALPTVVPSSAVYGYAHIEGHNIPIAGIAGDQQSALFGQMCSEPGMVKNTYGTGCFMLMNTGTDAILSKHNLLTTVAWQIGNEKPLYALEGSVFIAGAAVQWLRDGLRFIPTSPAVEELASSVTDTDGVYFVPAFAGLGAPYWNQDARGTLLGMTRGTTQGHVARATLEAIAFQVNDVLIAMQKDAGLKLQKLKVDGGATQNNMLMQFQSDISNCDLEIPANAETTALGAAYLAGLATGFWSNVEEIKSNIKLSKSYHSGMNDEAREQKIKMWNKAIEACIAFAK